MMNEQVQVNVLQRHFSVYVFTFLEGCGYTARTYELLFPIVAI